MQGFSLLDTAKLATFLNTFTRIIGYLTPLAISFHKYILEKKKLAFVISIKILLDYKSERNVTKHGLNRACVLLF